MVTRTCAIKNFLQASTLQDLANLYNFNMEVQVNVAQDGGRRIDGDYKGRHWTGWTDGATNWKSFRIPRHAKTEPEYTDSEIRFDLAEHAEGIGLTGWDWVNKVSKWVAFDFDSLLGHSDNFNKKLTQVELEELIQAASAIDWVTIRKSTSGKGLHLYVFLNDFPTENHTEHAAVARAIIGKLAAITGYDFESKVDMCGGVMWIWHRKMRDTDGLHVIKHGRNLPSDEVPINWKDHIHVVTGSRRKNLPQDIESTGATTLFEELAGQRPRIELESEHKKLIDFLRETNAMWWWDQDNHMLVTHTIHLQEAFDTLSMRGYFKTISHGREKGNDHNCFCFPMRKGGWVIRRFTPGVQESDSWDQDGQGWTRCYLNREPDITTAAKAYGGLEDPSGGFVFREAEIALKSASLMGVHASVGTPLSNRQTKLKQHKDGRLVIEVEHRPEDRGDEMSGWLAKKGVWTRIFNIQSATPNEPEIGNYDDLIRHLVTSSGDDFGWMIKSDNVWRAEPLAHVRIAMQSLGLHPKEINNILGSSILKCWKMVNKPFQPEYPGDREWNRTAAQLRYTPTQNLDDLRYPTWLKVLQHCGEGLTDTLARNPWAKTHGVVTGADYLKIWIASLFQNPTEPLPYLFMYGPQNSGKSIFHEAISLLLTSGYRRADVALTTPFNGELDGAVLCVIEEINLSKDKAAYNKIKDWVTSRQLNIHRKNNTPYHITNTTHWVQCANEHTFLPLATGDTRIVTCYVDSLDPIDMIPKRQIIQLLEKEAPDFIAEVLSLDIPPSNDRLNVPILETEDKTAITSVNRSALQVFIDEKTETAPGYMIKFSDFCDRFYTFLDSSDIAYWSKIRVGKELPIKCPKGRKHEDGQFHIGNIAWTETDISEKKPPLVLRHVYLESKS